MKKIALHNLGCKVNAYELEVMQQSLQENGYQIVPFDEKADIYIVNTCTVTNMADRKSRQMLHRAKQKNPEAVVVAVGCYVQTAGDAIEQEAGIDLAIGNNRKKDLVPIFEEYLRRREEGSGGPGEGEPVRDKTLGGTTVIDIHHTKEYEETTLRRTAEHTRAYIKIQDGCNQFCSYCVIPYARGRVRSRGKEEILAEIRGLAEAGYREVVLTGIHISSYGVDREGERAVYEGQSHLIDLVEEIHRIGGVERIRLGSLEPRVIREDTVERLAGLPKLCPHFHLSLQSGCDETLRRMNRHYTTGEYYHSVELLRGAFVHPAITTDVIVGFPGETEAEFERTREFLEKVCFYEMHVFKYSRRAGTRAASMPDQVPEPVKTARSDVLLQLERRQSAAFREYYIGRETQILLEETKEVDGARYRLGHTGDYVRIAVPCGSGEALPGAGEMAVVKPVGFLREDILAAAL